MSAELGVGVRVWVGWCPDQQIESTIDGRAKTGTIIDGPFMPGDVVRDLVAGSVRKVGGSEPRWNVELDTGSGVSAPESLLFPIDDGEPEVRHQPRDITQPAEA